MENKFDAGNILILIDKLMERINNLEQQLNTSEFLRDAYKKDLDAANDRISMAQAYIDELKGAGTYGTDQIPDAAPETDQR